MSLLPFSPPPGINSDDTTFKAEGQYADGSNVRFVNGQAQTVGGTASAFTLSGGSPAFDLFAFTRSGAPTVVYGLSALLYVGGLSGGSPGSPSNRTPAVMGTDADDGWTFASWGSTLLAAGRGGNGVTGGKLYEQSGSGAATEVTQAPDRIVCMLVSAERQVLAFGCNEESSGTFNALCIRGSDIEDYTDWTTSSTNNAFEHVLDGPGDIVTAKQVGSYVAVWTTSALYIGQYVGNPGQAYRFDKVAENCKPSSIRSVTVMDGIAYWLGADGRLRAWAPGGMVQIIQSTIGGEFVANGGTLASNGFTVAHPSFQEIWHFYLDSRDTSIQGASRYIAYSLSESAQAGRPIWFRGVLARTALLFSDALAYSSAIQQGIASDKDGVVYTHEAAGSNISGSYIQSGGLYLDNSERRVMIKSVLPDFEDLSGGGVSVQLSLLMRSRPHSTSVTKGPFTLTSTSTKKDFRASGKIATIKLVSSNSTGWRLGKLAFDIVPTGER